MSDPSHPYDREAQRPEGEPVSINHNPPLSTARAIFYMVATILTPAGLFWLIKAYRQDLNDRHGIVTGAPSGFVLVFAVAIVVSMTIGALAKHGIVEDDIKPVTEDGQYYQRLLNGSQVLLGVALTVLGFCATFYPMPHTSIRLWLLITVVASLTCVASLVWMHWLRNERNFYEAQPEYGEVSYLCSMSVQ